MKTLHFICPFSGLATASCHTCLCLQPEVGSRLPHMYVCVCVCCSNCGNIKHGHEQSEKRPNRADQANSGQTELTKATQTKATVGVAAASVVAVSVVAAFGWCRAIRELQQQQQPRIVWTCRPETKVIAGKCCGQMFNMQKAGWRPLPLLLFPRCLLLPSPPLSPTACLIAPLVFPLSYFVFPPIFS